jgi:hypothetical protein
VWLYAFSGIPDQIQSWSALAAAYRMQYLAGDDFDVVFRTRFDIKGSSPWPTELIDVRPTNEEFQQALMPSSYSQTITQDDLADLYEAIKETVKGGFQGLNEKVEWFARDVVSGLISTKRLFVLGEPGVGKTTFANIVLDCFAQVFGADRVFAVRESITDRTTPESLIGYVSIGGSGSSGVSRHPKRMDVPYCTSRRI